MINYNLELHEHAIVESKSKNKHAFTLRVTRVPGGWLYDWPDQVAKAPVFVPYVAADRWREGYQG